MTTFDTVKLFTFPARPVDGGPFEKALPKRGAWTYEPKGNGWRSPIHIPTGTMFNRHGEKLSISAEFAEALAIMRDTLSSPDFEWADCEALERRHGLGRGTLYVIDVIPHIDLDTPYSVRQAWLDTRLQRRPFDLIPANNELHRFDAMPFNQSSWNSLQVVNAEWNVPFYEGMVGKRNDSIYPIQLQSANREYPYWQKNRWAF